MTTKNAGTITSHPECKSCRWNTNSADVIGGVIRVGKHLKWRVNHHQGEAILGWLALQPDEHQPTLDKLSDEVLDDLGSALRSVQKAMAEVWIELFPDDLLERIHTVSFMESEFDEPPPKECFHVHIFLIPRSKLLGKVIRERLKKDAEEQYVAWHDYKLFGRIKCQGACQDAKGLVDSNIRWDKLNRYINPNGEEGKQAWKEKIEKFMNHLQDRLSKSSR